MIEIQLHTHVSPPNQSDINSKIIRMIIKYINEPVNSFFFFFSCSNYFLYSMPLWFDFVLKKAKKTFSAKKTDIDANSNDYVPKWFGQYGRASFFFFFSYFIAMFLLLLHFTLFPWCYFFSFYYRWIDFSLANEKEKKVCFTGEKMAKTI